MKDARYKIEVADFVFIKESSFEIAVTGLQIHESSLVSEWHFTDC